MNKLSETTRYIGTDDLDLDLFEGQYIVPEGISYNSYLILDEKVAVLDTCDARKGEEWKRNLTEALEGRTPDYLIVHHMEPDHSALTFTRTFSSSAARRPSRCLVNSGLTHHLRAEPS